ncbi:MAG: hypothetical protein M9962_05390 [Oligoflexia bacterium]|nr:hypothetical protein [Oligoflexia bacterium]
MKFLLQYLSFTLSILVSTSAFAADFLELSANGRNGLDGFRGTDHGFSRAMDGYRGFNGNKGGSGSNGLNGGNATRAASGTSAGSIILTIMRSDTDPTVLEYSAQVNHSNTSGTIELTDSTAIRLSASGGNGGNGAVGGSGQDGGNGGDGGDASAFSPRSGDGGDGGNGGQAGMSTSGADGGNGGRIILRVPTKDEDLLEKITYTINVSAGNGGRAPLTRSRPGRGGRGGIPGDNCFFNRENQRQCVSRGFTGRNGFDGTPIFENPTNGKSGQDGSYLVEVF